MSFILATLGNILFCFGHIIAGVILVWGETKHPIALGNPLALLLLVPFLLLVQEMESG